MNRDQILESSTCKRNFCKIYSIPVQIYANPYFEERLQALDMMYDCLDAFDEYCYELEQFESEEDYLEKVRSITDNVRTDIKSKIGFGYFLNDPDLNQLQHKKYPTRELYIDENNGKTFVSIDMNSANYNSLRWYDNAIFDWSSSWTEYLNRFTDLDHLLNSKYFRQVVLSECCPKKQRNYMYSLMEKLLDHLIEKIPQIRVFSLKEDEILIEVGGGTGFTLKELVQAMETEPNRLINICRMEVFDLWKIPGNYGWVKGYQNRESNDIEFKCLDCTLLPQIVKHFYDLPITENDLVFYHNGHIAKYLNAIENPWNN